MVGRRALVCCFGAGALIAACALNVTGTSGPAASHDDASAAVDGSVASQDGGSAGDGSAGGDDASPSIDCGVGSAACGGQCVQTTSNTSHCGGCEVACVGSDASCTSGVCAATLRVRGYVDDTSQIVIQGKDLHWFESHGAAPGLWQGANDPTYIDSVPWTPVWPSSGENRDCNCGSSATQVTPLAAKAQTVALTVVEGRGTVTVSQQPEASNAYTAVVSFTDPPGGAAWYEILLGYQTN